MNAVTFTEREAIRQMLDYIEKERERLFNQSLNLLDRLRNLDEIDRPSVENKLEFKEAKEELIEEEVHKDHMSIPMQIPIPFMPNYDNITPCNLGEVFLPSANDIKPTTLEEIIDKINEERDEEKKSLIPKTEIEAQKDKDERNKPVKTSSQRDVKMIAQYVKAILKEAGVPIRTSELIKRLDEVGVNTSSPYVLLAQVSQYDPKIEKPKFGFYQYNFSA